MSYSVLLYYNFAEVEDPSAFRDAHFDFCRDNNILGRIYVAYEGINGTCAGRPDEIERYKAWLRAWPGMGATEFKEDSSEEMPFRHLRVKVRTGLVNLGEGGEKLDPREGGEHMSPARWRSMLEGDAPYILLDVRNRFEADVGRFRGAIPAPFDAFHQFGDWVDSLHADRERPVLMYCTGGIRCEKFSVLLKDHGYREVYQLDGGILNYAKEEGGAHFLGDVVVFDDRLTVDIGGEPNPYGRCVYCEALTTRLRNCADVDCHRLHLACAECAEAHDSCCSDECRKSERLRRPGAGSSLAAWKTAGVATMSGAPAEGE